MLGLVAHRALLYLVVTFAPLGFAARVNPGGRHVARRACMPRLVWRTIPVFEAAAVTQGAERAPLRAETTAATVAVTAALVARLAGASEAAAKSTTTAAGASTSDSPTLVSQQLLLEQLSAATRPRIDPPVGPWPTNGLQHDSSREGVMLAAVETTRARETRQVCGLPVSCIRVRCATGWRPSVP